MEARISGVLRGAGGSVALTQEELTRLCDGSLVEDSFVLSAGQSVVIEIDLDARYILDRVVYYYTGGVVSLEVSESLGLWYTLPIVDGIGFCYCNNIGYKPKWLKITHVCTTTTAVGREVSVFSGYTNILFGSTGVFSSFGLDSTGTEVEEIPVYNNTNTVKDILVFIEENGTEASDILAYSLTSSGLFYNIRDVGIKTPTSILWDNGKHFNTVYDGVGLTISGSSVSGTYYSPVLDLTTHDDSRFFWCSYKPEGSKVDYFYSDAQEDCFGFRSFYIPPSGSWINGSLAEDYDYYWSVPSGSLPFRAIKSDDFVDIVPGSFVQFAVTITGSISDKPYVYSVGFEDPLVLSSVPSKNSSSVFVMTSSGTLSGKSTNLLCFSKDA